MPSSFSGILVSPPLPLLSRPLAALLPWGPALLRNQKTFSLLARIQPPQEFTTVLFLSVPSFIPFLPLIPCTVLHDQYCFQQQPAMFSAHFPSPLYQHFSQSIQHVSTLPWNPFLFNIFPFWHLTPQGLFLISCYTSKDIRIQGSHFRLSAILTVQATNPAGLKGVPGKGNNIVLILKYHDETGQRTFVLLNRNCAALSWQDAEQPKKEF